MSKESKKQIINKTEFLDILKQVKVGIGTQNSIESMAYFFFSKNYIVTYNNTVSIQYPFKTDFSLFVKAKDLFTIISKVTAKKISIQTDKKSLHINSKSMKASLNTISDDEIVSRIHTVSKYIKKAKWKSLPDNFLECVSLCSFASSKNEEELTLSCIHVNKDYCVASDNKRIAHAELDSEMDDMFLKSSEVGNLALINPTKYYVSKSWLHFKNKEGCVFSIRKVQGEFPDFSNFLKFKGNSIKMPKNIVEGTDLASIFVTEDQRAVEITIKNKICLVSISTESGTLKFKTKIDYKGTKIQFLMNPDFLKEMLGYSTKLTVNEKMAKLHTDKFTLITALAILEE